MYSTNERYNSILQCTLSLKWILLQGNLSEYLKFISSRTLLYILPKVMEALPHSRLICMISCYKVNFLASSNNVFLRPLECLSGLSWLAEFLFGPHKDCLSFSLASVIVLGSALMKEILSFYAKYKIRKKIKKL